MNDHEQWQQLTSLYASLPDDELIRLYEQKDELTPAAQDALAAEFRSRKITPPELEPKAKPVTLEPDGTMVELWGFFDALQASGALETLRDAEIDARLVPGEKRERSDGTNVLAWHLIVPKDEQERCVHLLRKHRGLFPLDEKLEGYGSGNSDETEFLTLAMFDEVMLIEHAENALRAANIPFKRVQDETEEGVALMLQVPMEELDRASEVVEPALQELMDTTEDA